MKHISAGACLFLLLFFTCVAIIIK